MDIHEAEGFAKAKLAEIQEAIVEELALSLSAPRFKAGEWYFN
ncbi:hypothetical protein [Thalassococcus lentus]|uniref:Uncharacterized protein n=1 Tax=Thalassococcus lentus TaxID=1210524 RepID=A0ABT4XUG7_9RHOB|nr:hypothetical protein [Thalassococcus lentus]MDA7425609.1 hypothetical protein [Thalassococcus lentus]